MSQFRHYDNGDVALPHRGNPPQLIPEGYTRDAGDPYLFHPILPTCLKRVIRKISTTCCGTTPAVFCGMQVISPRKCIGCKESQSV